MAPNYANIDPKVHFAATTLLASKLDSIQTRSSSDLVLPMLVHSFVSHGSLNFTIRIVLFHRLALVMDLFPLAQSDNAFGHPAIRKINSQRN